MNDSLTPNQVTLRGFEITISTSKNGTPVLSTAVFSDTYIPGSVRTEVKEATPLNGEYGLASRLQIDEAGNRVVLTSTPEGAMRDAFEFLDAFLAIASEWESRLKERGEQDLVHVRS